MASESPNSWFLAPVADCLDILVEQGGTGEKIARCLAVVGRAMNADRACFFEFENHDANGHPACVARQCWARHSVPAHKSPLRSGPEAEISGDVRAALLAGREFCCLAGEVLGPLKNWFDSERVLAAVFTPVKFHGDLIGFLSLEDCRTERVWQQGSIEALRAISSGIGSSLIHERSERSMLARTEELTRSRRVALSLMEDSQRAVEAAQEANRAKSAFLAMMSHEIRTPLNGVIGFTELLQAENLPPRLGEMVSTIQGCGNSLLALINDILDISKIESGRFELDVVPCEPEACAREVVASLGSAIRQKSIEIQILREDSAPACILADPKRLRQILFNLVGNSVKFTSAGTICIRFSASDPEPDGLLTFSCSVSDSGMGISEEEMSVIFEAFAQADSSIQRRFGGTGLGLAICRALVEAMGGRISVASEVGKGTTFTFTLAVRASDPIAPPLSLPDTSPTLSIPASLRILAVDDVATNLRLLGNILRKFGCDPVTANNGNDAVRLATESPFDIIFMDILMPECDGIQATERIRAHEATCPGRPAAHVIALTADAFLDNKQRCLDAGMNDFLTKPLRIQAIREALNRALSCLPSTLGNSACGGNQ